MEARHCPGTPQDEIGSDAKGFVKTELREAIGEA